MVLDIVRLDFERLLFVWKVVLVPSGTISVLFLLVKLAEIFYQTIYIWLAKGSQEVKMLKIAWLIARFPGGSRLTQWFAVILKIPGGRLLAGTLYRYPLIMPILAACSLTFGNSIIKLSISSLLIAGMLFEFMFLLSHRLKLGTYDNMIVAIETQWLRSADENRLKRLMEERRIDYLLQAPNQIQKLINQLVLDMYHAFDFTRSKLVERVMLLYMATFFVLIVGFGAVYDAIRRELIPGNWLVFNIADLPQGEHWFEALYFSVVTQLTVRYGDYAPVGMIARTVAVGQMCAGFGLFVLLLTAISSTLDLEQAVTGSGPGTQTQTGDDGGDAVADDAWPPERGQ